MACKRSAPSSVSGEEPDQKKPRAMVNGDLSLLEAPVQGNGELLHLDDPNLLMLIKNLNLRDRLSLGKVCLRLKHVCQDPTLWCDVDANHPMTNREIRQMILPMLHHKTSRIALKGFLRSETAVNSQRETISPSLLVAIQLKCPNLRELKLTKCFIDASKVTIEKFPKTLERLMLPDCEFVNVPTSYSFFRDLRIALPSLRQLDLSGCEWVTNHCLIAICKLNSLEELSLRGCCNIGSCFAYTALACRFGFKTLKKLDLRDTGIGNTEVSFIGKLPELTHLKMGKSSAPPEVDQHVLYGYNDGITDSGLFSLYNSPGDNHVSKLQHLTLTNLPGVTDEVMSHLAVWLPLKSLDVSGTQVSAIGADAFSQIRPNCDVVLNTLPLAAGEVEAPVNV